MWKRLVLVFGMLAASLGAQAPAEVRGLGRAWTDLGQPGGSALLLNLEAAGVSIVPSEDGHVRARYTGREERDLSRVRLRFEPSGRQAELRLSHTPNNDFQIELQVPRTIDLTLRMTAGEVTIQGVDGNKDFRLHAGEVTVRVGDPAAYGPVSASVWAGEVQPGPFGEPKEGLFKTFSREGQGRYSLHVKVKAGEVTFKP
jgi:hypothetical protein